MQLQLTYDPSARKHKGHLASMDAHGRAVFGKRRTYARILRHFRKAGPLGLTAKKLEELLCRQIHTFSGRLSELKMIGFLRETTRREDGCTVLVHRRFAQ